MTKTDKYVRVCPHCIETIPLTATACKFCGANLAVQPAKGARPQMDGAPSALGAFGCTAAVALSLLLVIVVFITAIQLVGR